MPKSYLGRMCYGLLDHRLIAHSRPETSRNHNLDTENLHRYRKQRVQKGYFAMRLKPSVICLIFVEVVHLISIYLRSILYPG